ncbi:hypothetical protein QZM72_12330 [Burkholderia sp. AU45388]|nr:hypothetical protein [Burkholderia sp. AU45388]MDN7427123.1 hypothetical protein [Burkholderia sp. AU45388]
MSADQSFCERPGYAQLSGRCYLADFWVRYVNREELVILLDSLAEMPQPAARPNDELKGIPIRLVTSADLAAACVWLDNWRHILPCLVAARGLVSTSLLRAVEIFVTIPHTLLEIERERALTAHPDGRLYGFRALILHARVADYVRLSPVKLNGERGSRGAVGALSQLLERFPALAAWLQLQIKQHRVALIEIRTGGELRTHLSGLQGLHVSFLWHCRQCGFTAADYPFNTTSHAIRSLSARVKSELLSGFGTAARAAGATHLKGLPRRYDFAAPAATRP